MDKVSVLNVTLDREKCQNAPAKHAYCAPPEHRWTGDGPGDGEGDGSDKVTFDVGMDKPKRFPLNAHVLGADLAILANVTVDVDLAY